MSYYKNYDKSLLDNVLFIPSNSPKDSDKTLLNEYQAKLLNNDTIVVDIGCGNGHFLTEQAQNNPQTFFIGIDIKQDRLIRCREKEIKRNLNNIIWICSDALIAFKNFFSDNVVDTIYMLFPDPWPKRKHWKNRLFNTDFLSIIINKLKVDGLFTFVTDHQEYYKSVLNITTQKINLGLPFQIINDNEFVDFDKTLFAIKWKQQNKDFYSIKLKKI